MGSIPIIDAIIQFIQDNRLAIAALSLAIIGGGLLVKPLAPQIWAEHKAGLLGMVVGGILLMSIDVIAAIIVGA